jgi:hypothetical protein
MRRTALLIAILASFVPAPVSAQAVPRVELFGGYAFVHDANNDVDLSAGWIVGGAVGVNSWLSAVCEVGSAHRTVDAFGARIELAARTVMAGARASARIGRLTESAQLAAGVVRSSGTIFGVTDTTDALALQPGVAVDYRFAARMAARVQLDARVITSKGGGNEGGYQLRLAAALAYRVR